MKRKTIIPALLSFALLTACAGGSESSSADSSKPQTESVTVSEPAQSSQQDSSSIQEETGELAEKGLTKELLAKAMPDVNTVINGTTVMQDSDINGYPYTLTIDLKGWAGNTTPEQIATLSRLFWQSYPAMFERFGVSSGASRDVTFIIDVNYDYEIAATQRDVVYLQDKWLGQNKDDYDCITHELAHVIQNIWDEEYLEYSSYIERFADYCRYIYALDDGYFNDSCWCLKDVFAEDSRETSVRFLVWLDYTYSTKDNDLMRRFYDICYGKEYQTADWESAWAEIFKNTELEGKEIDEVWGIFAESDFAIYDSTSEAGGRSQLLINYDIRNKLKA